MIDKTFAVIVAGGSGNRMKSDLPKQFIEIAGKPIIIHTIEAFMKSSEIDEIIVMVNADYLEFSEQLFKTLEKRKPMQVFAGGKTRNETTNLALEHIPDADKVLIQDSVRPFIDQQIITNCIQALNEVNAATVAIEAVDTILQIDSSGNISEMPNREQLRLVQTPQAFRAETLKKAYNLAMQDPEFFATDDCSVVFKYLPEEKIKVIPGNSENIKITNPLDLAIAEIIAKK